MTQSTRTGTDPRVPQSVRSVISQHRVAFAVVIGCCAMVPALVSWFLAAVSLTGVEPNGEFVDCGPALLGRPSPLPDPTCGDAYLPIVVLSVAAGLFSTLQGRVAGGSFTLRLPQIPA